MDQVTAEDQLACFLSQVVDHSDGDEFLNKIKSGKPLRVKFGADPSRPDLHLGHCVSLYKLKHFQDWGHEVIFLIGDYTARIGDPTGRDVTRPQLSPKVISANAQTYLQQVFQILDPQKITVHFNSQWLSQLNFSDLLNIMSSVTINQLLHREDFGKRYETRCPIHLHEFLYPLLQAYDSVHLKADVEIGGQDQRFNLLFGRQLQEWFGQKPQSVLFLPLIEGTDGKKKMSKSYDNGIFLNDAPQDFFGKLLSLSDDLTWSYLKALDLPFFEEQKRKQEESPDFHPMQMKLDFAERLLAQFHSVSVAKETRALFVKQFSERQVPENMPVLEAREKVLSLAEILLSEKILPSKSEVRRLLSQGAIKVNGHPHSHLNLHLDQAETILKIGKRRYLKILRKAEPS